MEGPFKGSIIHPVVLLPLSCPAEPLLSADPLRERAVEPRLSDASDPLRLTAGDVGSSEAPRLRGDRRGHSGSIQPIALSCERHKILLFAVLIIIYIYVKLFNVFTERSVRKTMIFFLT